MRYFKNSSKCKIRLPIWHELSNFTNLKGKKFHLFLGQFLWKMILGFVLTLTTTTLSWRVTRSEKEGESDWWEVALKSPLELLMMIPTYTYKWLTYNLAFYFLLCFTSRENKESIGGVCTETEQMCPIFFKVWMK